MATIILDRSLQNRIDDQIVDELATAVSAIERSDARVVLVRAAGESFSFGGDITSWPDDTPRQLRARFEGYMDVFNRFERLPLPSSSPQSVQEYRSRGYSSSRRPGR
ncbi:hypothetical protein ACXPVS_25395 [Pseudomonas sp. Ma2-10]